MTPPISTAALEEFFSKDDMSLCTCSCVQPNGLEHASGCRFCKATEAKNEFAQLKTALAERDKEAKRMREALEAATALVKDIAEAAECQIQTEKLGGNIVKGLL